MTFLSASEPIARKPHRCDQCRIMITRGERHVRQSYVDGTPRTYRAHTDCNEAAEEWRINAQSRDDEGVCLHDDVEQGDWPWIVWKFPAVAARLGIPDNTLPVLMHKRLMMEQNNEQEIPQRERC